MSRILCATVTLAFTVAGCAAVQGDDDLAGKKIRYEVAYTGLSPNPIANRALSITYAGSDGEQEQRIVALPWTADVEAAPRGFTPTVRAQFYGVGTIACRILVNDFVIDQRTSPDDPYAVVECSA